MTQPAHGAFVRLGLVTALLVLAADQASKLWLLFVYELGDRGVVRLTPFLDFVLTWNYGISYGLFQGAGVWLLLTIAVVAIFLLGLWLWRAETRLTALALALIIGGAVGNGIDRFAYGAVADFVHFHITTAGFSFSWYVFNLADAAIVAGVVGLLYESFFMASAAKAP